LRSIPPDKKQQTIQYCSVTYEDTPLSFVLWAAQLAAWLCPYVRFARTVRFGMRWRLQTADIELGNKYAAGYGHSDTSADAINACACADAIITESDADTHTHSNTEPNSESNTKSDTNANSGRERSDAQDGGSRKWSRQSMVAGLRA
jgi:hypothetical protein